MVVVPLVVKIIFNIMGVTLIGLIVASCLLTILTVVVYFVMIHDCSSNNEDDCFLSDTGLDEENFNNMTMIQTDQLCLVVGKYNQMPLCRFRRLKVDLYVSIY